MSSKGIKPFTARQKKLALQDIRRMKKEIPKRSINDICHACGIHYSSFYAWSKQEKTGTLEPRTHAGQPSRAERKMADATPARAVFDPEFASYAASPAGVKPRTTAPPPAVPKFLEDAIKKEINHFLNQMDQRIHAAMEAAVIQIAERYHD